MPLSDARRAAQSALAALSRGEHPADEERRRRAALAALKANSFPAVADQFIKKHVNTLRTAKEVETVIRRELIERWMDRSVTDIKRRDVIDLVEEVVDRGAPYMARNLLAYTRKLFNWEMARNDAIEVNPCDRVKATELIGRAEARQRILTDDELRVLWRGTAGLVFPFDPFVRLLLVLGCRRGELLRMSRAELDLRARIWTLSGERTKNADPRIVPLPRLAIDILKSLPASADYVFATPAGGPIAGISDMKERLDKPIGETSPPGLAPWRLHDLRRTMRTHLSALRLPQNVAELMIGHRQRGIVAVYDLHTYIDEQRDGFELWTRRLLSIVEPRKGKVVRLRA
jgi:integrase